MKQQIRLLAIKEGVQLDGTQDLHALVIAWLFAEIEGEVISLRTKAALAAARAAWIRLDRPREIGGWSRLARRAREITHQLALHLSKATITKIVGVDGSTLYYFGLCLCFMRSRKVV